MPKPDPRFAIKARRILLCEAHTPEYCVRAVYSPVQRLLTGLEKQNPKELWCFRGPIKPLRLKPPVGLTTDAYIIGPRAKVLFLGAIMTKAAAKAVYDLLLEEYKRAVSGPKGIVTEFLAGQIEVMERQGCMAIARDNIGCRIPVNADRLTVSAIEQGVRAYLERTAPGLSRLPIKWLPEAEQKSLETEIRLQSRKQAKPQTKQEKADEFARILLGDIF